MNKAKKKFYVIDMVDEASRMYYGMLVESAGTKEILEAVRQGIAYFKANGIIVNRIRTDHCNIFKKKIFMKSKEFRKFLEDNNIRHQYIPFQKPQYNGLVERMHRIINDELVYAFFGSWWQFRKLARNLLDVYWKIQL